MSQIIEDHKPKFEKSIEYLKTELKSLHTGRATSGLVENIIVEAYGVKTPLQQLAGLSVPEPRIIVVQPWDKNVASEIEKAIANSDLSLGIANKGGVIHLTIPPLNEEGRKKIIKILHQRLEHTRVKIHELRDNIRKEIIDLMKRKEISEDEKYRLFEELDELSSDYHNQIKEIGEKKEREIMTI